MNNNSLEEKIRYNLKNRLKEYNIDLNSIDKLNNDLITVTVFLNGETGPWSNRVGFDISTGAYTGPYWLESMENVDPKIAKPSYTPKIMVISDYVASWIATVGALQALKLRSIEGGSYKVTVSLARVILWLMSMGIFDKEYAKKIANSDDEHAYVEPDFLCGHTPMGYYKGVDEQVQMKTKGHYKYLLDPLFSSKPEWER